MNLPEVALEGVLDERALRLEERQAGTDERGDGVDAESGAEDLVVALGCFCLLRNVGLQLRLRGKRQTVNPREHRLLLVAPPVGAGHAVDGEAVGVNLGSIQNVRAAAEIGEDYRAVGGERVVEGNFLTAAGNFVYQLELERVACERRPRLIGRRLALCELQILLRQLAHSIDDSGEVLRLRRFAIAKCDVVVEAALDDRPDG